MTALTSESTEIGIKIKIQSNWVDFNTNFQMTSNQKYSTLADLIK